MSHSFTGGVFHSFQAEKYIDKAIAHLKLRPGITIESFALALTGHQLKGNNSTNVRRLIAELEDMQIITTRRPSPIQSSITVYLHPQRRAIAA